MNLNNRQKRFLKGRAHNLEPAVTVGSKGLSESVVTETDSALGRHELIKVKIPPDPKSDRQAITENICVKTKSIAISLTGRVIILFRLNPKKTKTA